MTLALAPFGWGATAFFAKDTPLSWSPDNQYRPPSYRAISVIPRIGSIGTNGPTEMVPLWNAEPGMVSQNPSAKGSPVSGSLFTTSASIGPCKEPTLQLILSIAPLITGP